MKEIITRFKNESPSFFKKLLKTGITVGAIGGALVVTPGLPAIFSTIGAHMVTAGVIAGIVSKFTVSDPSVLTEKQDVK